MSMVVAFTITPWLAYHVLRSDGASRPRTAHAAPTRRHRDSTASTRACWARCSTTAARRAALLVRDGAARSRWRCCSRSLRAVPLKMLPFDNKNEFQVVLDADEGTTLERTDAAARSARGACCAACPR